MSSTSEATTSLFLSTDTLEDCACGCFGWDIPSASGSDAAATFIDVGSEACGGVKELQVSSVGGQSAVLSSEEVVVAVGTPSRWLSGASS